jgi:hypothetical protein
VRLLVTVVVAAAAAKVWYQDHLHRNALGDALLVAYRQAATESCGKESARGAGVKPVRAVNWTAASNSKVVVGHDATEVDAWDVNNPLWNVRFRHPHIVLTGEREATCAYDLVAGLARVSAD